MNIKVLSSIFVVLLQIAASVEAFSQSRTGQPETVFSNPQSITINSAAVGSAPRVATTYPSTISVSGMTGNTTRVAVTLVGLSHPRMIDADFLLVSPTGAKYVFLSDSNNGSFLAEDLVLTFADDAATTVPTFTPLYSGAYRPTSGDGVTDQFPSPAPIPPYNQPSAATFASTFNGTSPNGDWSLYMVDDQTPNAGSLNSGWQLTITTDGAPTTFSNTGYIGLFDAYAPSAPYGTSINVSGMTGAISKLRVTLTGYTHSLPPDVDILLVSPGGQGLVLMSDIGAGGVFNVDLTFDDDAPNFVTNPIVSGSFRPTDLSGTSDFFPSPAPLTPYFNFSSQLSSLNGFSPNGLWQLFVVDAAPNNSGSISGGWTLDITTSPIVPPPPIGCAGPSFALANAQTGTNPTNLVIADLNNDRVADLAVTNQVSNDVSILLGNGDGTFAAQSLITAGSNPYAIAAGTFDADKNVDLAVVNSGANTVSIFLGNGDGTFDPPTTFSTGPSPISIAVGDFNNDTKEDLAIANFGGFFAGTVSILLGNGNGGFTAGNTVRTRTQPSAVAVARLNADTSDDLVVANFGSDNVSTFFGTGTGTFALQQAFFVGSGPVALEIVDLDGNGFADLAVANYNADTVRVFGGNASGLFNTNGSSTPTGGSNPVALTSGDFLGNGTKSLVTALSGSDLVQVLTASLSVGEIPNAVETADLNTDGRPDLVTVNSGSNDVSVLINSCLSSSGNIFDFNADGRTDHAVYRPSQGAWYYNQPNGFRAMGRPTDKIVPADYNGDNRTDFAVYRPESGLWVVQSTTFKPLYFYQFGTVADIPVPADYDGDGKADIAVWRPSDGNWYIKRSTDGGFGIVNFGIIDDKPVPADYDGDNLDDIAVFRPSTGVWYILKSSNGQVTSTQFGISEDKTVQADYDADGKADIAVWRPSTGVWWILKSLTGQVDSFAFGTTGDRPVPGDYDGDGRIDQAVFRPSDKFWYVKKSSDNGFSYLQWGVTTDLPIPNAYVR